MKKAPARPISAKGSNMASTEGKEDLIETRHADNNGGLKTDKIKVTRVSTLR